FKNGFSMRWTGYLSAPKSGEYIIDVTDNNGMDFYFDGKKVLGARLRYGIGIHSYKVNLQAGKRYPIRLDYFFRGNGINIKLGIRRPNDYLIKQAAEAARKSDLVLVFAGRSRYDVSEGHDLTSLRLPGNQDELLNALTRANPKTVVVVSTGEAVEMDPWNKQAGAVVDAWFGGEEAGNAIADVLMGDYNPSGKLPLTFPYRWDQTAASKTYAKQDSTAPHQEGILVGYRYFDAHHIKPLYPFGYGLSYTTFNLSNVSAGKMGSGSDAYVDVHFTVKNTGNRAGAEVAQVYIHKPDSKVERAPHALKGFSRVYLEAGQSKEVTVKIPKSEFAYYDVDAKKWTVEPGAYELLVGTSSRDLPLHTTVNW
ncbi:MAG TPA: glycoside hydrolase family 3 C-terminal domain-containing protein, partial [Balneolales bacterium]|nr:glycoside hydrolase family 3 C-terminal domain-containing protein [Balneolales bacterium]